jgi:predicted DNA-binding WGR domain protein
VSTGNMALARTILDSLVERRAGGDTGNRSIVAEQLKKALQQEGYEVAEAVGQSGFRCSLAVRKNKEDDAYTLGIMVDDDTHYANENLLEQYWQRPAILEDFGWRTVQVFCKDWLQDPARVLHLIKKRLEAAKEEKPDADDAAFEIPFERTFAQAASVPQEKEGPGGLYDHLVYTRLQFSEGNSNKFWEAAVEGTRLVVRFGRIGTRGQTQVKTFPSEVLAREEAERLLAEKKGKGYL